MKIQFSKVLANHHGKREKSQSLMQVALYQTFFMGIFSQPSFYDVFFGMYQIRLIKT